MSGWRGKPLLAAAAALLPIAAGAGLSDPAAVLVSTDRAFATAAHSQGEWTAFRAFADPHAELFVPQRVQLGEFGAGRADPAVATRWKPEQAWISCDGSAGITFGRWHLPGSPMRGWYEAVWGRTGNGSYKLMLRRAGSETRRVLAKRARATCTGKPGLPITAPDVGTDFRLGASRDQTLIWSSAVSADGRVRIVVSLWDGARHQPVLVDEAPPAMPR